MKVLMKYPRLLLKTEGELETSALQVKDMLQSARNACSLLSELPQLLEAKTLVSVLVSLKRWYPKREPLGMWQGQQA
jgi:hypothetical protein